MVNLPACHCLLQPNCIVLDEDKRGFLHPFPLPKYTMDVEIALKQGKLLACTYQKVFPGTARAMLSFKRHPTPDERNRVAVEVVEKFPFLKSPGSKPEVNKEFLISDRPVVYAYLMIYYRQCPIQCV